MFVFLLSKGSAYITHKPSRPLQVQSEISEVRTCKVFDLYNGATLVWGPRLWTDQPNIMKWRQTLLLYISINRGGFVKHSVCIMSEWNIQICLYEHKSAVDKIYHGVYDCMHCSSSSVLFKYAKRFLRWETGLICQVRSEGELHGSLTFPCFRGSMVRLSAPMSTIVPSWNPSAGCGAHTGFPSSIAPLWGLWKTWRDRTERSDIQCFLYWTWRFTRLFVSWILQLTVSVFSY